MQPPEREPEIKDGRGLSDYPGPEARESFIAWWLADLADRYPGRTFRIVPKEEWPPVDRETGAQ